MNATNLGDSALTQSYTYDSVGNMTYNSKVGTYLYPAPGAARPHTPINVAGQPLTYDANGNMISGRGRTIAYDGANRPSSIDAVTFTYGPDGARLKKVAGGVTTLYLGADIERTAGVWTKYYHADAMKVGAQPFWLHRDHLNTVRVQTNGIGAISQRSRYAPYGKRTPTTGSTANLNKGFIGERHDVETGLIFLNARYYDPVLARFITPDDWDPTLPGVGINRYAY